MSVEVKVPPVGESITEVTLGEWLRAEGDFVRMDEPVVVVESDKVNLEVPAPVSGRLVQVLKKSGATAKIGEVVALIEEGDAPRDTVAAPAATAADTSAPPPDPNPRVMPSAGRVLAQAGVDPRGVTGTGPGGRIVKDDAVRAVADAAHASTPTPTPTPSVPTVAAPAPAPAPTPTQRGPRSEELVPMTPLRQTVARRLVEAQQNAALLTTFNEIDMSAVMALRTEHKEAYEERYGLKLGFMSFFVKAVVDGLRAFPALNAEIRGTNIAYRSFYDIGVAVGGGKGLVVPIIRNAEHLSFAEIEKTIADFGKRAKENKLKLDELTGGTFSITNGGIYGSLLSTPIVNPPQSGILGMHGIQDRPIALNGQVVIRPMMYVALTYDHRLVDGREAVTFLKRVKQCVEQPVRLLLEV
jgi:2-oxoglutarate dehydrogenase E2 component (dihydrolipoamide succinyltransferase)